MFKVEFIGTGFVYFCQSIVIRKNLVYLQTKRDEVIEFQRTKLQITSYNKKP